MTNYIVIIHSRRLFLQVAIWIVVLFNSSWEQRFNFSLVSASVCDDGVLHKIDDILVVGLIDMQGHSSVNTLFEFGVEVTHDYHIFSSICNYSFRPTDCNDVHIYGCYCAHSSPDFQILTVMIRQAAELRFNGASYNLQIYSAVSKMNRFIIRLPYIYGEPTSELRVDNATYALNDSDNCVILIKNSSESITLTFCTYNLRFPVLTMTCDEGGISYYINNECGIVSQPINDIVSICNFTYEDGCQRFQTFQCFFYGYLNEEVKSDRHENQTAAIFIGSVIACICFLNVVISMLSGISTEPEEPFMNPEMYKEDSKDDMSSVQEISQVILSKASEMFEISDKLSATS